MIDPKTITNFYRTEAELQEFLLFCIIVAGKNSHQQAQKLESFLNLEAGYGSTPFEKLQTMGGVAICKRLMKVKMGQYKRITTAFWEVSKILDLTKVTVAELQSIKGIGPKTARFFVMHSRPNQKIATLDTHILKWLKAQGVPKVPKSTPSGKRYLELEKVFLTICDSMGKTPAELDLEIWNSFAKV